MCGGGELTNRLSEKKIQSVKIRNPVLGSVWCLQRCTLNKVKEMISTFMQRGVYDDPAEQNRSKCSPHYVCPAAAAVSETRRSVPDNSQHPDERSKLPLARHLHHPSLSDEGVPAATNGEARLKRWRSREVAVVKSPPSGTKPRD